MQANSEKHDPNTDIGAPRLDRLSSLMQRFPIRIGDGSGSIVVLEDTTGAPECAEFWPHGGAPSDAALRVPVDWGGAQNPMIRAIPDRIRLCASTDAEATFLMRMLLSEVRAKRCGADGAIARLCEVLMIRMLRAEIGGRTDAASGLLCGLSHPQISRALTAMHDAPGRRWLNADLAEIAGLSLSRFAELFVETVGVTPMSYLRLWRLSLARREIEAGGRIKAVARRLGYASPEALSRAFSAEFGHPPRDLRAA